MSGDVQARFCERLGVGLPGPTHLVVLGKRMEAGIAEFLESKLEGWLKLEINRDKTRTVDLRVKGASKSGLSGIYIPVGS